MLVSFFNYDIPLYIEKNPVEKLCKVLEVELKKYTPVGLKFVFEKIKFKALHYIQHDFIRQRPGLSKDQISMFKRAWWKSRTHSQESRTPETRGTLGTYGAIETPGTSGTPSTSRFHGPPRPPGPLVLCTVKYMSLCSTYLLNNENYNTCFLTTCFYKQVWING